MKLGIFGAGGMGREVMLAAKEAGQWDEIFFILDKKYFPENRTIKNCRVFTLDEVAENFNLKNEVEVIICLGEPTERERIYRRVRERGVRLGSFVDPTVRIHEDTRLGEGVILLRGCILASDIVIEDNAALSFGVVLGHDNHVGAHTYLAPRVVTGGHVVWGKCAFGGLNAAIREGCRIGDNSIVGLGAVVVKDVEDGSTVIGNPARPLNRTGVHKVFR